MDLQVVSTWYLRWVMFRVQNTFLKNLVSKWSLLFQKATQTGFFEFFQFYFFLAFNSRDMTMLWVLNLFSRSSPTKLWKRIFDKMSQKFFFWHSKLASGEIFSYWLRGKCQIWVRNFDENFFFNKNFLCSLIPFVHVVHHLGTVKSFHSHVFMSNRHVKDATIEWDFVKDL